MNRVTREFLPSTIDTIKPEMDAALDLLVWGIPTLYNSTSPGLALHNLAYKKVSSFLTRRSVFIIIAAKWAMARLNKFVNSERFSRRHPQPPPTNWRQYLWFGTAVTNLVWRVLGLLNLLVFLKEGKHRHLSERLTGLQIVGREGKVGRDLEGVIHYDNLSRQLVWSKLSEFSVFLLSLVNWRYLQNRLAAWLSQVARRNVTNDASDLNLKGCSSCHASPATMPYVSNCSHVFCYHCIQSLCVLSTKPTCPRCGEGIVSSSRVSAA
jgi:hypothetical protein